MHSERMKQVQDSGRLSGLLYGSNAYKTESSSGMNLGYKTRGSDPTIHDF